MKAILMSIRPQHLVNILNGKKTIEIRKTMPKCALPIDVYIYCTKDKKYANLINRGGFLTGMVVAKFTLEKISPVVMQKDYKCGRGYAWHISNLVIFDKPKELGEFSVERYAEMPNGVFPCYEPIIKAPQSWQYVCIEEEKL